MRALPLIPLLLGGWLTVPAQAASPADARVTNMFSRLAQAERQQDFQGTFVYERNGIFSTHRIWHRVQDGKITERLLQLDGLPQEVVRVDGQTQCVSGTLVAGVGNAPDSSGRLLDPLKLMSWYDIKIIGVTRVAGREVDVVALTPRDQHRYAFELHLDKETGLPLKSLLLNDMSQLLERFQFTGLDIKAVPSEQDLQPSSNCKAVAKVSAQAAEALASWRSDWLPPGFELVNSYVRKDPQTKATVSSLMYDDGLARFSVFLEPLNGESVTDTRTQLGPTVAVSRHLTTPKGEIMVTVVGEIPIGTAERVALSMRAQDPQSKN
ncbi:MucB/RseB C-terminal domain-containing protein [Pseudomonas sp. LS1212]|uniref:MucB/RseB C-terminal domain-containing protein n=1 Tax=Pseudomonas sp. LS1212 TaxID=2972478 RepID=UPI00215CAD5E|nr:MucB/RseB C-terminal domain-containing protein [Pseudomonas sp. LS1212]UVJ43098.1 MucB/RseB C-terminal domain-containing protein [Pseudomonas sp. LS1212]